MEARIGVRVVDDLAGAALEDGAGDAEVVEQTDLARSEACGDVRVQLAGLVVVEEDRAAVRGDLVDCRLQQRVDHGFERVERGDAAGERREHLELPKLLELLGVHRLGARRVRHRRFASSSWRIAWIVACSWRTSSAACCFWC